ncbi:tetratricopeptide repeat-containing sensor histidine kinase [Tenacibaculum xiamenense]|uniref:tetratricopeptide repeat-containing sensor histidine kinase n=1 Tax=Tenacibaculum xiamenense TaxID=1261553 RepID=UPI003895C336
MTAKYIRLAFLLFFYSISIRSQDIDFQKLEKEVIKISDQYESDINFKKATTYFLKKKWDSTLIYTQKQLITSKNQTLKNFSHFLRGYCFDKKGIFKEAENEYNQISKHFNHYDLVDTYLGLLALEQSKFKKAISHFEVLLDSTKNELNLNNKSLIIHNLGLCYLHLKKFGKAEIFLKKSTKFQEIQKDTIKLIGCYGDMATLYYEQYKDDLAIPYFEKAYNIAKTTNNFYSRFISSRNMSVVEENRKDFEKALKYRKEAQQWKDSLNDQNRIYEVAQKEKEFAVQQKQKEVDFLQVKNELQETQRNIFLYSAVGLLIVLGGILYFYREKVKNNRIITEQKETLDELNATKDKLFSIVSHDLRSSVNSLKNSNKILVSNLESKNLIALEDLLKKNSTIVNGAYGLLDNLLNWALLQTKQQYFHIEKQRLFIIAEHVSYNYQPLLLEKELSFENTVSKKDVVYADQESLKIVLRNLLDNAIKFSKTKGSIKIYTRNTSEDYCDLVIEDTGLGMSEETRLKLLEDNVLLNKKEHEDVIGTGLGLQLCKSMIKKNNGKFDIESELGKGTKMIVSLPKIPLNG